MGKSVAVAFPGHTSLLFLPTHLTTWADPEGGLGVRKNHKNVGFFNNIGPDPLQNHKATEPVGPSSAHQRNAI